MESRVVGVTRVNKAVVQIRSLKRCQLLRSSFHGALHSSVAEEHLLRWDRAVSIQSGPGPPPWMTEVKTATLLCTFPIALFSFTHLCPTLASMPSEHGSHVLSNNYHHGTTEALKKCIWLF